ncbi:conjugal transfer protein TraG [Burkholderiales bacterium YL45]|uniref:Conjugal transfer protein TraG n=12 Tax=Turicimonas muris TaxID=1796652 RepID=A0A227KP61_9BURK|nr:type IV secretory system conjugative DNA transfer family protein [Turicimonas muris]ANU67353.2 conjugal transfer protein TraG [Burkholderiales bacterium YL45]OXE49872.1 conjugal transfer protein TraG [Turicimonas muris]
MQIYGLPVGMSRPWTIIQYWAMYRESGYKWLRLAVNFCFFFPWLLLVGLAVLIVLTKDKRALHGAARFATMAEVKKAGLIDPKKGLDKTILVGKFKDRYLTYGGFQFVLLAAPTRSGKGVGVVVPNCLNYSDSLVVLDIKGENFDITSGFRKACGQEVYLFSPYDEEGKTHRYNPLDYVSEDPAERLGDIDAIGQALYAGENNNDKFWSENAKDFFRGVALFVLESPELPNTLGEILRQASGKGKPVKEHLLEKLKEAQEKGHPYSNNCVDALNRVLSNSENTLASIVATFNTALLSFQNPKVDLATSASDFDLREVRRKRMSVYFKIEPTKLKDARVLINLFFDQLLNLNTRKLPSQDKSLKYQCLVLLDEMTSIGTVNMIKQAVSYMAGYNMRLLTIIQNKSQLEDVYGKAGAVTLLSNHALMIMYAPSPATQSDANEYSEMLGYQTVKSKSTSTSKSGGSTSQSDQRRALMLPQEIQELGTDNEIVTLENTKPILCKKIRYYKDPEFTKRANWQTPDIPIQDVNLFVAQLEQRIRAAADEELKEENAANSIVTGDTSLPADMANIPDSQWTQEQIHCYLDNLVTNEIGVKSFSNPFANLNEVVKNASQAAQTNYAAAFSEAANAAESDSEGQENTGLESLMQTESEENEETEETEDSLLGALKQFDLVDSAETKKDTEASELPESIEITAEIEETSSPKSQDESETALRKVEARVTANIETTDWTEDKCAKFVGSLIEEIKKQLVEVPAGSQSSDYQEGSEDAESASEKIRSFNQAKNLYRRAARRPLSA